MHIKSSVIFSFIVFTLSVLVNTAFCEIEPPNYDFSLDRFEVFVPNTPRAQVEQEYGEGELMKKKGNKELRKFYVAHIRYKFPVFVQFEGGKVHDFMARLPTYFLHDVFHRTLIEKYGKQEKYFQEKAQAVYTWPNINGNTHLYSGTCTITCFPIYYAVFPVEKKVQSFINSLSPTTLD